MTSDLNKQFAFDDVVQQLQVGSAMPAELMEIFAEEAEDHLRTIYDGLQRLRLNNDDPVALADVRRSSHTFKGAAGAVGLQAASKLAHRMEDLLDRLAARNESVTTQQLKLLFATADQLQGLASADVEINFAAQQIVDLYQKFSVEMGDAQLPAIDQTGPTERATAERKIESAGAQLETRPETPGQPKQYLRVPLDRLDQLVSLLGEMMVNRSEFQHRIDDFASRIEDMQSAMQRLAQVAHYVEAPDGLNRNDDRQTSKGEKQQPASGFVAGTSHELSSYRDGFDPLEFESFTDSERLGQACSEAEIDAEMLSGEFWKIKSSFDSLLRRQAKLNRDAQKSLMRVRMVPLSGLVGRLERTVRTVAGKVGRQVELEVIGERIELDKTVLDGITDPFQHLIRNAIDHGVEEPEIRAAAGKPEIAKLRITAVNKGTQVELRISDDGAGIHLEKVRQKGIEQGLIEEGQELTDDELQALIFRPGFSTAQNLTDVSGRGVGMDVVGDAIRRLKGSICVESRTGVGTTFTIQLPTTLGVMRAVIVEASGKTFAIPMQSIRQILLLDPETVIATENGWMTRCLDRDLRLVDLAVQLGLVSKDQQTFQNPAPLLLIQSGVEIVALTADAILGSDDIVVKTLGDHLKNVRGIIGATINGDGSVVPILETSELVEKNQTGFATRFRHKNHRSTVIRRNTAMVIDDSISVRCVTEQLLTSHGWDVVTAHDGVDALEKLAGMDTPPDVFLSDMEMPRMDGLELIRQIREQPEFEVTPIVMITSRSSEKHRHKAFEAGATEYVVKPYNDVKLLELIAQLLQAADQTPTGSVDGVLA